MRFFPNAIEAALVAIALYFALLWGFEALYVLLSPDYGLEDYWRSQVVYGYGRMFGLSSVGLMRLAAFFAATKLAAAIAFALHLLARASAFPTRMSDHDMIEAALVIVAFLTPVMVLPAIVDNNGGLVWQHGLYLLLTGIAVVLSRLERSGSAETEETRSEQAAAVALVEVESAKRADLRRRVMLWRWANKRQRTA